MVKNKTELIFDGTVIAGLGYFLSRLVGYLYKIIISRLGAATFGSFSLAYGFIAILETLAVGGMGQGLTRYIPYLEEKNRSSVTPLISGTIKKVLVRSVVITALFVLLFPYIARYANNSAIIPLKYPLSAGVIVLAQMELLLMVLVGLRKIKTQGLINYIMEPVFRVLIAAAAINIGFGLYGIIAGFSISTLLIVAIVYLVIVKNIPVAKGSTLRAEVKNAFSKYSGALFTISIMNNLIIWLPLIYLSRFSDPATVGNFGVILPTAQLATVLGAGLSMYFLPVITSSLYQGEDNQPFLSNCLKYELILLTLPVIIVCLNSSYILEHLFGTDFLPASQSLAGVSVVYGFYIYSTIYEKILLAKEQTNKLLVASTVGLLAFGLTMVWLTPAYKLVGASFALSTGFFVRALLTIMFSQKKYVVLLPLTALVKMGAVSMIIIAINYTWETGDGLSGVITKILAITILYLAGLIVTKVISRQELKTIFKYSKIFIRTNFRIP